MELPNKKVQGLPRAVQILLVLLAITAIVSLLYAIQHFLGGPVRLATVSEILSLDLSPDGRLAATGAADGLVRVWEVPEQINTQVGKDFDIEETEPWTQHTLSGLSGSALEVRFAPDGASLVGVSSEGEVQVWHVSNWSASQESELGTGPWVDAALDASTQKLATLGEDGTIRVWDLATGQEIQAIGPGDDPWIGLTISDDGTLVASGEGMDARVWDAQTGELVRELVSACSAEVLLTQEDCDTAELTEEECDAVLQTPDVCDPTLMTQEVCEAAVPTPEDCDDADENWLGHRKDVTALGFSADNALLATGGADTNVVFWNLETGEADWTSAGHWAAVSTVQFHEDGDFLLSGGKDYKARTLRAVGGKSTAIFQGHLSDINDVAFGPWEDTILTVSDDGTLRLWSTANQYLVHLEWSRSGLQSAWGRTSAIWMLVSGLAALLALWGLQRKRLWAHLLVLTVFLLGPIVVLGLPLMDLYLFPALTSLFAALKWLLYSPRVVGLICLALAEYLACYAIVVIGTFRQEGTLQGVLTLIVPFYAYVKGWLRTEKLRIERIMLVWTVALVLSIAFPILIWRGVLPLAAPEAASVFNIYRHWVRLLISWPLLLLLAWYIVIMVVLTRERVAVFFEAPQEASLSEKITISQRTLRTRFGINSAAVWIALLVILYSVLRRFDLDIAFMGHWLDFIMKGSWITFKVSFFSIILAMVLALLGALGRLSKSAVANAASGFYISLIRGTPLLVQIYIWYLGLPRLDIVLDAQLAGILALGVNYGAYMTEIFRAGIQAVSLGQREAAQALGMSSGQTFRRIILPQAFRIVIPPIGNEFIAMMKDSSLVSVMAVQELTWAASKVGRQYFRGMETFIIAAAFYWILTVIFQLLQGRLEEYMARSERR